MIQNKKGNLKKTVWLPPELCELASKMAKSNGQTLSDFIKDALTAHLTTVKALAKLKRKENQK